MKSERGIKRRGNIERVHKLGKLLEMQTVLYLKTYGHFEMLLQTRDGRKSVNIVVGEFGQIVDIEIVDKKQ